MNDEKTDVLWRLIFTRALDMLQGQLGYKKNQALAIISEAMWIAYKSYGKGCSVASDDFIEVLAHLICHKFN